MVGPTGKWPPIAVKLKGEIAAQNPWQENTRDTDVK